MSNNKTIQKSRPKFTVILLSHNKPEYVMDAIKSLQLQTLTEWECILMDSGILLDEGFFNHICDDRFLYCRTHETPKQQKKLNMAAWCINNVLTSGAVKGYLVFYLCDDDIIYPNCLQEFWNKYQVTDADAMYSSQHFGRVENGTSIIEGTRHAIQIAGRKANGMSLDFMVDYLQFCHTHRILNLLPPRPHSERKFDRDHADGIFMEAIGALTPVIPIPKILSFNRRTSKSINRHGYIKNKFKGLIRLFFK